MKSKTFLVNANNMLNKLSAMQGKRDIVKKNIAYLKSQIVELEKEKNITEEASRALLLFLESGKEKSKAIFEEIGTIALSEVFGDGYELSIDYSEKWSASSAEIRITAPTGDDELTITTGLATRSGGLNDIVSIAFRLCALNLLSPEPQGPLIADEAFKHLSKPYRPACAFVLRSVLNPDGKGAETNGRQFIFSTHADEFIQANDEGIIFADKVFRFTLDRSKNMTIVRDVSNEFVRTNNNEMAKTIKEK